MFLFPPLKAPSVIKGAKAGTLFISLAKKLKFDLDLLAKSYILVLLVDVKPEALLLNPLRRFVVIGWGGLLGRTYFGDRPFYKKGASTLDSAGPIYCMWRNGINSLINF